MDHLAPDGPVYQAGTLSGNPVAMAAGLATLAELGKDGVYERLDALGARLQQGWTDALAARSVPGSVARVGSVLWVCLAEGETPRAWHTIEPAAAERYAPLHRRALRQGVWLAPSAYEVAFVSLAHDEAMIDRVVEVFDEALVAEGAPA
jgi:glutamate-1-semialdehyde 2,1-aminomutase